MLTLPGTWYCRFSAGTGWSGVSKLWLDEKVSLISNCCLSVVACTTVIADLWNTLACCWDVKQSTTTTSMHNSILFFHFCCHGSSAFFFFFFFCMGNSLMHMQSCMSL